MATPYFYHQGLHPNQSVVDLSSDEAAHARQSRRLELGSEVGLVNGLGGVAFGKLVELSRRSARVELSDFVQHERASPGLTVASAVPKGDRQKVMIDQLTQLGVSKFVPLEFEFSASKATEKNLDKLRRISIEACKQSQNPWALEVDSNRGFEQFIADYTKLDSADLVCADAAGRAAFSYFGENAGKAAQTTVIIGPEGGFSPHEFELIEQFGITKLKLGPHILRTETAAIAFSATWASVTSC